MCYISKTGLAAAIVVVCGSLFADDYELKLELSGSDSIDWSDAASYTGSHSSGPSSGDTVYIPDGMTVKVTAGTASWTSLNNIQKVIPVAGSVLEINVPDSYEGAAVLQTPISGIDIGGIDRIGKLIKKGGGVLEFASYGKVVYNKVIYDYYVNIDVEEGSLKLYANGQSSTESFFHGAVNVAENAMLKICNVGYTYIAELNGAGRVTLDNTQAQRIRLNGTGPSSYSGFMDGKIRVDITAGRHDIIGTENTFNGSVCLSSSAVCGFTKLGMNNQSGSIGKGNFNFSGTSGIVYLGTEDEISDKDFWLSQNAFIDGGAHGGLTFSGKMSYSGVSAMRILTLRGSNADNPCIISGTFPIATDKEDKTVMYIKKAGAGTWRFAGGDKNRSSLGVIDVEEGTLQFESIAEKGVLCSLGYSTNLFNAVTSYDKAKPVKYAFVLGSENALGTMEYTGIASARCSTRPMAIRTNGRFISDSAPYCLENVYALGAGERTLTLAGGSDHENAATGISDGTDGGRLSVEKEGAGTWKLLRPTTFTGPVIARGGVLRVDNSQDRKYRWFRMCFTENGYGSARYDTTLSCGTNANGVAKNPGATEKCTVQLLELALYDSEGNNLLKGFTSGEPNAIARYDSNGYYAGQEPGTVVLGSTGGYGFNTTNGQLYNLFDAKNTKMAGYSTSVSTGITVDNPDSWMKLVVRLPDDAPEAVRVDFMSAMGTNSTVASYNGRIATAFRLDGSADGVNWDLGIAQNDALVAPSNAGKWYSDPNGDTVYGKRPGKGFEITKAIPDSSFSHSFTCVGASNGGVIDIVGSPYTVSGLVVDASASAGAISNVVFSAEGTVYIENVADMDADSISLPGDYSHLDGVENLSKWEFSVGGESFINRMLTVENGKLCLRKRGLRVIFR